ncbi:8-amino-7-oxononanoate synthase [Streptomyces sp. AV19]|uniref:8-amino-7-oxononanoate synthase n=1 Tax=Streptomyces sp. AV19 TaxID=2793068 RepID=UPI0018FEB9DE|nr:8-amino-7-oxononanoate synthase [Streptomyces sp. AV19]MBH1937976.1 8-amino-7-oxononanoate synthase [Streptomyces sp. AV19]MDG4536592.1 8-amino-7-oxononanoate synthase [Streptomyces sp. AV19]
MPHDAVPHDAVFPSSSTSSSTFDWLDEQHRLRREAGLVRTLRPRPEPRAGEPAPLDLAGNDYLGLSRHLEVTRAAADAARLWGAGSTGSRLVSGSTALHARLEEALAEFCGFEAALVFSSGYAANLAAVTALAPPPESTGARGLLVCDEGNHASLIDGCRLARAGRAVVPHSAPEAVGKALAAHQGRALMVTDSVFSVDGDAAPLAALARQCRRHGAGLLVDDAHGLGVLGDGGRGAPYAAGLAGAPDVVTTVTLSKSLGAQGGVVLGPARVIGHLVSSARTFIFDTGLAPAATAAALTALEVLRREPGRAARVRAVAARLHTRLTAAGLTAVRPDAAVVSVRAPSPRAAVRWQADCRAAGVEVGCFRPPSVPDGVSRLRLTARADLTDEQVERAADIVVETAVTAGLVNST